MKVTIPHDENWKRKRIERWNSFYELKLVTHGVSKQKQLEESEFRAATKEWFIAGDLSLLFETCEKYKLYEDLSFHNVLKFCPILDINDYLAFIKEYAMLLSHKQHVYWGNMSAIRDSYCVDSLSSLYRSSYRDSSYEVYAHMLKMLRPNDEGISKFAFGLGIDEWRPEQRIAPCNFAFDLLNCLHRYLFDDAQSAMGLDHLSTVLDSVKHIASIDKSYFDTELTTYKRESEIDIAVPKRATTGGQQILRTIIGNLLGYKTEDDEDEYEGPLRRNDPILEQKLKDLIDSLDMPDEYYRLVAFIHENPEDFLYLSE